MLNFCFALVAFVLLSIPTPAQMLESIKWENPVELVGSDTNSADGIMRATFAQVPTYTGAMGTLTGIEYDIIYKFTEGPAPTDRAFLYGVENGDNTCEAEYAGSYGGGLYLSTIDRVTLPDGSVVRREHFMSGCSFYAAACPQGPLDLFDGQWDFIGDSGHTAGGAPQTLTQLSEEQDYQWWNDFTWAAEPWYQPGWEYTEPSFPSELYSITAGPTTYVKLTTYSDSAIEWLGQGHWQARAWTLGTYIRPMVRIGYRNIAGLGVPIVP